MRATRDVTDGRTSEMHEINADVKSVASLTARLRSAFLLSKTDPAAARERLAVRMRMLRLRWANRLARSSVTGDGVAVVNLTTYGDRTTSAFYTIESIAAGTVRPRRLILWIDERNTLDELPRTLARLRRRGLEILPCAGYRAHNKQYAYAISDRDSELPLVTADDDVFYPATWLGELIDAYRSHPDVLNGYRAHTVKVSNGVIAPYREWQPHVGTEASFSTFLTGVSGVIYPPALLNALKREGLAFRERAPAADDVWVHSVAVRAGLPSRQIHERQREFTPVPGTQHQTLYRHNVVEGGNDVQIRRAYGTLELSRLSSSALS